MFSPMYRSIVLIAVSIILAGSTMLSPAAAHAQTAVVSIQNYSFQPATMTVAMGTTVTWTNYDSVPHTSTSDTGIWNSGTLSPGMSFQYTFNTAGTFTYHCMIHPFMHGTIVVQGTSPAPPPPTSMMVTVNPSTVVVGHTGTVRGTGFSPDNFAFVFWQRPDRTTHGVWVVTNATGMFSLVLGFSPRHGIGTEFVAAFDWGRHAWAPFAAVTVIAAPPPAPGLVQLFASPNPVMRNSTSVITGRGFTPRSVVLVQWRRPDGSMNVVRVLTDSFGSFAFQLFADPRFGCGPRSIIAVDEATGRASTPLTLDEIC